MNDKPIFDANTKNHLLSGGLTEGDLVLLDPLVRIAQVAYGAAGTPRSLSRLVKAFMSRRQALSYELFSDYAAYLRKTPGEWQAVWPLALLDEGGFFRPPSQFEVAREVVTRWALTAEDRSLRILSLGTGGGAEIYSLAVMVEESGLRAKSWQAELYGLDLSSQTVAKNQEARFDDSDLDWLTPAQARKWFTPGGGQWRFKTQLTAPLTVAAGNIYDDETWPWPELSQGAFDLIFARNLTWEAPEKSARQLSRLCRRLLAPTGFIFTGAGELWLDEASDLTMEEQDGVIYYRRGERRPVKLNRTHVPKKARGRQGDVDLPFSSQADPMERSLYQSGLEKLAAGVDGPEEARDIFLEILVRRQGHQEPSAEALSLIALAELKIGRLEFAEQAAKVAAAITPGSIWPHLALAAICQRLGRGPESETAKARAKENQAAAPDHWSIDFIEEIVNICDAE